MGKIIAATGHRPNKLGGYDDQTLLRLVEFAKKYMAERKPDKAITGMALGWDTAWAIAAIEMAVPLIAAVPFKGQEFRWPLRQQRRYLKILKRADEVIIVSSGRYSGRKMDIRNRWMVDHADRLAALWDGSDGGTANGVN